MFTYLEREKSRIREIGNIETKLKLDKLLS